MKILKDLFKNIQAYINLDQENARNIASAAVMTARFIAATEENKALKIDDLLKIPTRAAFNKDLSQLKHKPNAEKDTYIIFIDIDGLKQTNDCYGHPVGDRLLRHTTNTLERAIRHQDKIYRVGGDELVIILNGSSEDLELKLKLIRDEIEKTTIYAKVGTSEKSIPVLGFSFGIHLYTPNITDEENYDRADAAMYIDKESRKMKLAEYREAIYKEMLKDKIIIKNLQNTENHHPSI